MRKVLITLACSVLLIAASGPAAVAAAKGSDRAWKASGSADGIFTPSTPGTYTLDGTSNNTHLRRGTFHVDGVCTNSDCSTDTFTFTILAANGDSLTASGFSVGGVSYATFTGGTGRFVGASGAITTTGTSSSDSVNPFRFHFTFTQTGSISY